MSHVRLLLWLLVGERLRHHWYYWHSQRRIRRERRKLPVFGR